MEHPFGNPFREDFKQRKPGVAGLVGDFFGEGAKRALEREIGKEKSKAPAPQEDWRGADIRMTATEMAAIKIEMERSHIALRSIPVLREYPGPDAFKKEYNLTEVDQAGYRKGILFFYSHDLTQFGYEEDKFALLGVTNDKRIKRRFYEATRIPKGFQLAKVVRVEDLIEQKLQREPNRSDSIEADEIVEMMDEAGYRPAILPELLAFSRDHWRPDIDPENLTEEERKIGIHARRISALGSPTLDNAAKSVVPVIRGDSERRVLSQGGYTNRAWTIYSGSLLFIRYDSS